jgi:transposase InsO family protein
MFVRKKKNRSGNFSVVIVDMEKKLLSKSEMELLLFEYIEIYYNQNRQHSALGNMTIKEFEKAKFNKTINNLKTP